MLKQIYPSLCSVLMLVLVPWGLSCNPEPKNPEDTEVQAEDSKDDAQTMSTTEVIFDPRNPPAGFSKCHRNHCHRIGGGVASYQQVMQEIGATMAINVPKPKPMPKAPSDVASVPDDAQKTKSGLAMKVLKPGNGKKPKLENTVVIHYTAWTTTGKGFDSSVARGEPAMIPLSKLKIKGLVEAFLLMSAGEQRRLWLPEEIAFEGKQGKQSGMIVFDVQLLEVL
jgi:FKBP-type peptidyl-prolyl cis-trans isomerase